jgi:predicted RNase H-like nuclease (RuvC/YqgF family)
VDFYGNAFSLTHILPSHYLLQENQEDLQAELDQEKETNEDLEAQVEQEEAEKEELEEEVAGTLRSFVESELSQSPLCKQLVSYSYLLIVKLIDCRSIILSRRNARRNC